MIALLRRNIKIYFSNVVGVIMSCLGALISFFIYIGFLQQNLLSYWKFAPNIKEILDLWIIAGIIAIAGITTSFQALGQVVKDRESRTSDDMGLTDVSLANQKFAYILSSSIVSLGMQIITFLVMVIYFKIVDKINIPNNVYLEIFAFMLLGAVGATMLNAIIVSFIYSSTTFSRLSSVIGAAAGFAVATYMPYGTLSVHVQNLIKCIPSSYEAASLRNLLLSQISKEKLNSSLRQKLIDYLGIHFKINNYQLSRLDNAYIILGMIAVFALIIMIISALSERKRSI